MPNATFILAIPQTSFWIGEKFMRRIEEKFMVIKEFLMYMANVSGNCSTEYHDKIQYLYFIYIYIYIGDLKTTKLTLLTMSNYAYLKILQRSRNLLLNV